MALKNQGPAAGDGKAPGECVHADELNGSPHSIKLRTATKRLRRLTRQLAAIAPWREDLQARIAQAQARVDTGAADMSFMHLEAECISFGKACQQIVARLARQQKRGGRAA
jgi:aminoglycoside phosphotransferase